MNLNGLTNINVELTSRCNKSCHICGRRQRDKEMMERGIDPSFQYGDMDLSLVKRISQEVPSGIVIALHNNGDSLLYPKLKKAIQLFKERGCITNTVTNGKLLVKKAEDIIDNLDTISISIFENDPEYEKQFEIIREFLRLKGDKPPFTTLRLIGKVDDYKYKEFTDSGCLIIRRALHSPKGSFSYSNSKRERIYPTIPEYGICEDFLNHLAIDRCGDVSVCVRFDPDRELVLGNIIQTPLIELWNCEKRLEMKKKHIQGKRSEIPFCSKCEFWGIATQS